VNFYLGETLVDQGVLNRNRTEVVYRHDEEPSIASVIWIFITEGIHHIFIGPDHILFIIGLLLMGGGARRLLKIVTAFTIAHSITLALASLQIVNPSPRIIEPAIALSIVYVGVENFISMRHERDIRAGIAFFFGFVHGFGFASVLREFGLPSHALAASLFAFNVGVELGQAAIVLSVAPLLALARAHRPRLAYPIVATGSTVVILAGGYWFVQRIIGS
jgi:hydrogenase/urease accessory protein HupE